MIGRPCSIRCSTASSFSASGSFEANTPASVLLVGGEHVHGEAAGLAHDRQRAGVVLKADQRQQRLQGQRAQRVGRHAAGAGGPGARDHGDARGEAAEHLAEELGIGGRWRAWLIDAGGHV